MLTGSITSKELTGKHYTIQPDETVLLSDLNIRVCAIAWNALEMWVEAPSGSDCCLVVEGLENRTSYPLQKKDCTLYVYEGWLGVVYVQEQKGTV